MSKLPLIDAKTFEKLLIHLGSRSLGKRGVMFFTNMRMGGTPHFLIIQVGIWGVH